MAEEQIAGVPDLDLREAEEIERLLEEEEERSKKDELKTHPLRKYLNKKLILGTGMLVLLGWGVVWGVLTLIEKSALEPQVSVGEQEPAGPITSAVLLQAQKPNIYPLEPFFVPILHKNKETGKFLHVTAHLVLSNRRLHKDIDKVRPLIRQSVYSLLIGKKGKDLEKGGIKIEEKIKRDILIASNSFLLSGTGTVTNIVFTEFIIHPS